MLHFIDFFILQTFLAVTKIFWQFSLSIIQGS